MSADADRNGFSKALSVPLLLLLLGFAVWWGIPDWMEAAPGQLLHNNIFWYLYVRNESAGFLLQFLALAVFLCVFRADGTRIPDLSSLGLPSPRAVAAAVVGLALCGWLFAFGRFPLCMDEFLPRWQAGILLSGRWVSETPEHLSPFAAALSPVLSSIDKESGTMFSPYYPAYSLLLAIAGLCGLQDFVNPALAGGCILVLGRILRRIDPAAVGQSRLALMLLALSPQFLVTSMTGYPLVGNLFLNLLWLELFLRRSPRADWFLPWLSIVGLAFHQPTPHALFVAPFLVWFVRERVRTLPRLLYFAGVGSIGLLCLKLWQSYASAPPGDSAEINPLAPVSVFRMPELYQVPIMLGSLALWVAWLHPLLLPFALRARPRAEDGALRPLIHCLWSGIALSLLLYSFFPFHQGHGWGYRYLFPMLGNLAILAALGVPSRTAAQDGRPTRLPLSLAFALFLLTIPPLALRIFQASSFVVPFADADRALSRLPAQFVLLPTHQAWYTWDLVRNEPDFSNRPLRIHARKPADNLPPGIVEADAEWFRAHGIPDNRAAAAFILRRGRERAPTDRTGVTDTESP